MCYLRGISGEIMKLSDFKVDRSAFRFIGAGLARPESVIADRDGNVVVSDARGGVVRISGGHQEHIGAASNPGSVPNGLAWSDNDGVICADFGRGCLDEIRFDGSTRTLLTDIDGQPIGRLNHVCRDQRRIWLTVSTRADNWLDSVNTSASDGYIIALEDGKVRIAAEGLSFPNECRVDPTGSFLYVTETTKKRVKRFAIGPKGELSEGEVFGPSSLGAGLTEGIAFDSEGNLWVAMTCADRIVIIAPDGSAHEALGDAVPEATAEMERVLASGANVPIETLLACGSPGTNLISSIAFGGSDMKTVFLGNLKGSTIATFQSPVAGISS